MYCHLIEISNHSTDAANKLHPRRWPFERRKQKNGRHKRKREAWEMDFPSPQGAFSCLHSSLQKPERCGVNDRDHSGRVTTFTASFRFRDVPGVQHFGHGASPLVSNVTVKAVGRESSLGNWSNVAVRSYQPIALSASHHHITARRRASSTPKSYFLTRD